MSRSWLIGRLVAIALCIVGAIWIASQLSPVETVPTTDSPFETTPDRTTGFRVQNEYLYQMQAFFPPYARVQPEELFRPIGAGRGFWRRRRLSADLAAGQRHTRTGLEILLPRLPPHELARGASLSSTTRWPALRLDRRRAGVPLRRLRPEGRRRFSHRENMFLSADRNTVEVDQETSAVIAAYEIFSAIGDACLVEQGDRRHAFDRSSSPPGSSIWFGKESIHSLI